MDNVKNDFGLQVAIRQQNKAGYRLDGEYTQIGAKNGDKRVGTLAAVILPKPKEQVYLRNFWGIRSPQNPKNN